MNKNTVRKEVFKYLIKSGPNIKAKFANICGKTGKYDVPNELFQKRTKRNNRSLISWRTVKNNDLTIEQLDTFEGGVVVEFLNDDYFDPDNLNNELFIELCNRIGSNENVSAIITIRSEGGNSSSSIQREAFSKLTNNTKVKYQGIDIFLTEHNYQKYAINQIRKRQGQGNETWDGFLFVSIRGGQQDTTETHHGKQLTLFNPACEYANADVITDINLVLAYFAMKTIDLSNLETNDKETYFSLMRNLENALRESVYDSVDYEGNLLDYCKTHYSVSMFENQLTDPIQLTKIKIDSFNIKTRDSDSVDLTHNEAVIHDRFYWDKKKQCVLSPARPTNVFWSYHLSNMMQQDYDLEEYFQYEEERFNKRKLLIDNIK